MTNYMWHEAENDILLHFKSRDSNQIIMVWFLIKLISLIISLTHWVQSTVPNRAALHNRMAFLPIKFVQSYRKETANIQSYHISSAKARVTLPFGPSTFWMWRLPAAIHSQYWGRCWSASLNTPAEFTHTFDNTSMPRIQIIWFSQLVRKAFRFTKMWLYATGAAISLGFPPSARRAATDSTPGMVALRRGSLGRKLLIKIHRAGLRYHENLVKLWI